MNDLWAALIGAVVGGGLTAWTSARVTKSQWGREHKARRRERLEDALVAVSEGTMRGDTYEKEGVNHRKIDLEMKRTLTLALALAKGNSPRMAAMLEEWGKNASGRGWKGEQSMSELRLLNQFISDWISDAEAFESATTTLEERRIATR